MALSTVPYMGGNPPNLGSRDNVYREMSPPARAVWERECGLGRVDTEMGPWESSAEGGSPKFFPPPPPTGEGSREREGSVERDEERERRRKR